MPAPFTTTTGGLPAEIDKPRPEHSERGIRVVNALALSIVAGALVMSAALGVRQTFGLFVGPFSFDHGLPVTHIAFAIALHNLVWGAAQPFAGAAVDRYGAAPVVAFGAVVFAAGLAIAAVWPTSTPMPSTSTAPVGHTAAMASPMAKTTAPKATTGAAP